MQADEYYSTFIANGVCVGCFWTGESRAKYISANPCDSVALQTISSYSKLNSVYHCAMQDGGNALFYYFISFYWSKIVGPILGVFNSFRLFSFIISGITLWYLYSFLNRQYGEKMALYGGVIFTLISVPNLLFVRTYTLSALLILIFTIGIMDTLKSENIHVKLQPNVGLLILSASLPFFHFFNVFILLSIIVLVLYLFFGGQISKIVVKRTLVYSLPGVILFFVFYFGFNQEGRLYQKQLSTWYTALATNSELEQYKPSIELSVNNMVKKNAWAGSRIFGLKMNHPNFDFKKYSIRHMLSYIFLFLFIVLAFLFCINYGLLIREPAFAICSSIVFGYFILLNLSSLFIGNLVPFNDQYFFILFPITAILFTSLISTFKSKSNLSKSMLFCIFSAILLNAIFYCMFPPEVPEKDSYMHKEILETIENSYRHKF